MVISILLGQLGREDFPDRDIFPILGRPLGEYPMLILKQCPSISKHFLSTDSPKLKAIGHKHGFNIINRPNFLFGEKVYAYDVFADTHEIIRDSGTKGADILVLCLCNAPLFSQEMVEEGIEILKNDPEMDSVVTVSANSFYSLDRAFVMNDKGLLDALDSKQATQRLWFPNHGLIVTRSRVLEGYSREKWPYRWLGKNVYPLKQWGAKDVDYESDIPSTEYSLRRLGFTEEKKIPAEG